MKTAYMKATEAQRQQARRGSAMAPFPGYRQSPNQALPGWSLGTTKFPAPARPPLSAPCRAAPVGRLGSPAHLGATPVAVLSLPKAAFGLVLNAGVIWALLEVFPAYLTSKLNSMHEGERRKARARIIWSTASAVTIVNNILIPWFSREPEEV